MFERLRFARYALRFERAFKSDDWEPVKACFDRDARYVVVGALPPYDGEVRGADAIVQRFQRMLNDFDRTFDRRSVRLVGFPRVVAGELHMGWKAKYTLGSRSATLNGRSRCRFAGRDIVELHDAVSVEEWRSWTALAVRSN